MARLPLEVREATPADAAGLIGLWSTCSRVSRTDLDPAHAVPAWTPPSVEEAAAALALVQADPAKRLYVACTGSALAGVMQVDLAASSPLHLDRTVVVSELHVLPSARLRGVASALMTVAADWADEVGASTVHAWAPSASRDAHRFLTRSGFGQFATVRSAPTLVLRARLAVRGAPGRGSARGAGRLVAVRRSLRRTQQSLNGTAVRD